MADSIKTTLENNRPPPPITPRPRKSSKNLPMELQGEQKRRSSSRSIKRKRFDDEIVEYSMSFPQSRGEQNRVGRPRAQSHVPGSIPSISTPSRSGTASASNSPESAPRKPLPIDTGNHSKLITPITPPSNPTQSPSVSSTTIIKSGNTMAPGAATRRGPRATRSRTRRTGRPPTSLSSKNLGRWKPVDDMLLIMGVFQTNDLRRVHRGVKFSCKFSLQEIQSRWYSLLYESAISRTAITAMRNMHPETVESTLRKALFSTEEEELLCTFKSVDNPKLEQFQDLLDKNAKVFFSSRTARCLQNHWQLMKQYQLLPDQILKLNNDQPMQFSDAEELVVDGELNDPRNESLEMELSMADRKHKYQIRFLENELGRWHVLVDSIAGMGMPAEFDNQTLAILRGRLVRYLMRSKEITFGREAKDSTVDVDLSLEGPAGKISRRQGTIKLRSNGDFFIANEGKRPIFVDGSPLLKSDKVRIANNCVLEVCGLRFVFLVNYDLINAIRHESAKTTAHLN